MYTVSNFVGQHSYNAHASWIHVGSHIRAYNHTLTVIQTFALGKCVS